jgi:hypothetical protein
MKVALAHADGVVIHDADINPKLMEEVNNLTVPVLKAYESEDFHGAIDEFFDTVHAAKPILID